MARILIIHMYLLSSPPESDNCLTEDGTKQNISHFQDFVPINKAVNSFIESITMYIQALS